MYQFHKLLIIEKTTNYIVQNNFQGVKIMLINKTSLERKEIRIIDF